MLKGGKLREKCHCSFLDLFNDLFRPGNLGAGFTGKLPVTNRRIDFNDFQHFWLVLSSDRFPDSHILCVLDFLQIC